MQLPDPPSHLPALRRPTIATSYKSAGCIGDLTAGALGSRSRSIAPAGAVVGGNVQPGSYTVATNILIVGARPTLSAGSYRDALVRTVREVMGARAGVNLGTVSAIVGAQQTIDRGIARSDAPGWWVNLSSVITVAQQVSVEEVNRAIARALFQSATLTRVDDRYTMPTDGGPLLARLSASNACSGGADDAQVFARACSRFTPFAGEGIAALGQSAPASPTQTNAPSSSTLAVSDTALRSQEPLIGRRCTTAQKFWLRPTATFAQTGTEYPAGTAIEILAATGLRNPGGTLDLYQIRVTSNNAVGFAALSASDEARCAGTSGGSSSSTTRTTTTTTPTAPLAAVQSTGLTWWQKLGIAVVGLTVVGGGVWYATNADEPNPDEPTPDGTSPFQGA